MKKFIILLLIALAAWYGWKHYPDMLQKRAGHDVIIENQTGKTMERIRVVVDGQTLVKESLAEGQSASLPFKVQNDGTFKLTWQYAEKMGEHSWTGGMVPKGPMLQRHIMTVDADDAVMYRPENK